MLVLLGYQMYLFTDFVSAPEMRYAIGKSFLQLVYLDIGVNLLVLVVESGFRALRLIKKYYILRKHKKKVE